MTRRHLLWRGRPIRVSLFTCILTVIVVGPAWAQERTPAEMNRAITDLQTRVEALQKDVAVAGASRQLDAITKDLAEVKRTVQERAPAVPLSPDAWKTLGGIAALSIAAWAFVNLLREGSRRRELMLNAVAALVEARVKLGEKTTQDEINNEVKARITELQDLLGKNAAGSLSLSLVLQRLFRSKKS
jgi:hypothetical protein